MKHGGIFSSPNVLGSCDGTGCMGGLGCDGFGCVGCASGLGESFSSCVFNTGVNSPATLAIQKDLIKLGVTKLKADGLWGPCTESAWRKVFGVPFSKDSLAKEFGVTCGSFTHIVTGSACTNGTDEYTPPAKPTVDVEQPPSRETPEDKTGGTQPAPKGTADVTKSDAAAGAAKQWIAGVPNAVVMAGGAAVLLGVVVLATRKRG